MSGYAGKSRAGVRVLRAGLKRACAHDPTLLRKPKEPTRK
jgi:hypothetical protein